MKNSNSAIRRTAGRPIDLTRRQEQLKVAVEDLSRKLAPLGMNFAGLASRNSSFPSSSAFGLVAERR
jgi:hypothetical protein